MSNTLDHFIITIAGGSGCGKSTLANNIKKRFPDQVEIIHFDDYQKNEEDIATLHQMKNWDHPHAINFDKLHKDCTALINGNSVNVMTKCSILNPSYEEKGRIPHTLLPKRILIIEGYLSLYDDRIRNLTDYKIFLDLPVEESIKRRNKITYNNESEYNKQILIPMHKQYVLPTKDHADVTINVLDNSIEQILQIIVDKISALL